MPTATTSRLIARAASIGQGLPRGTFRVEVLGIHRAAINIGLDGTGLVASIVGPSNAGEPATIALAAQSDFGSWPIVIGTSGNIDERILELNGSDGATVVELDMAVSNRIEPPPLPSIASVGEAWVKSIAELSRIQHLKSTELKIDELIGTNEASTLARAILGLAKAPMTPSLAILSRIVGAGPGLTPAGDDFLVGFAAAAASAKGHEDPGEPRIPPNAIVEGLAATLGSTTALSASMLRLAATGCYSARLVELAQAIAGDDSARAVASLRHVCTIGHSSGADAATGFLYGLGLLCGRGADDQAIASNFDRARRRQHAS